WHSTATSRGSGCSGSSNNDSRRPAGPAMKWLSIRRGTSVGAVIGELHVDAEIALAQHLDHRLQDVAVASRDPHKIALDRRLHLQLAVFDLLDDLARFLGWDPLLQRDFLLDGRTGGRNDRAVG